MKTNIAGLMTIISEEEANLRMLSQLVGLNVYTTSIQELDGTINITEDNKDKFTKYLNNFKTVSERIVKLKSILYEKNNSFKLSDGRTIQEAIVENTILRKKKAIYDCILSNKSTKKRCTEVNNSYFETKTINYNEEEIEQELKELVIRIQNTDFEIAKLNSIEFEINI